jgi:DNA-binding beta-propeller fold protein YncE
VSVLSSSTLEVTATFPSATFPIRVAFTPDGRRALVSNARSGDVAVFDAASRKELVRIPMRYAASDPKGRLFSGFDGSPAPIGILVAPGGDVAWVANANADVIAVLDLAKNEVVGVLRAGREPDGLGFSPLSVLRPVPSPATRESAGSSPE